MRLKLDTSGRNLDITIRLQAGEEIEVSEERGTELARTYAGRHLIEVSGKGDLAAGGNPVAEAMAAAQKASEAEQAAIDKAAAPKPVATPKAARRKSAAKTSAKSPAK